MFRGGDERFRALCTAARVISSDLTLDGVLQKLVDEARRLIRCRYAALGALREQGTGLARFVTSGIKQEQKDQIGVWPQGHGLLGAAIHARAPIRLADLSKDPRRVGFPTGHPEMTTLLAVPIEARGRVLGNFYLSERNDGAPFDDDDEELLVAFASHAAVAIENATLHTQVDAKLKLTLGELSLAERRARLLIELGEILPAGPVSTTPPIQVALGRIAGLLGDACGFVNREDGGDVGEVFARHRDPQAQSAAEEFTREVAVIVSRRVLEADEDLIITGSERTGTEPEIEAAMARAGFLALFATPIRSAGNVHGVFVAASHSPEGFDQGDAAFARIIADRFGVAIENSRLLKKLGDALGERDRFIAIATHELRSPLMALVTSAFVLKRKLGDERPDVTRALATIERQTSRLTRLTSELLDVNRIDAGRLTLNRERGNLSEIVSDIVDRFLESVPPADRARIDRQITPEVLHGEFDVSRIEQLISNLLSNALKYSPKDASVTLVVEAAEQDAQIAVRDRGMGIPPAERDRVFEPFFRASTASSQGAQGAGLGLHICREIVSKHGGRIWFESEVGAGSTFFVRLPIYSTMHAESEPPR